MDGWVKTRCAYQRYVLQTCCLDSTPLVVCALVCFLQRKGDRCNLARNLTSQQLNHPPHIHGCDVCAGPPGQYVWQLSCEEGYIAQSLRAQQEIDNVGICVYNIDNGSYPLPPSGILFYIQGRVSCTDWGGMLGPRSPRTKAAEEMMQLLP